MTKARSSYLCATCGAAHARWSGRCNGCGEWNSLEVVTEEPKSPGRRSGLPEQAAMATAVALAGVDMEGHRPMPTGIPEMDRVLSGGLVPGSSTLIGGEPGTGKSTLLLQALAAMAASGCKCLLVAAEEPAAQVRRRAHRLGADVDGVYVLETTDLAAVESAMAAVRPDLVVVDSVQAIADPDLSGAAGSLAQVRDCSQSLTVLAKQVGAALVMVGHVTKDGSLAGPRALEHLVDTVLGFEGDRYLSLRALRALKHRFGPTGEIGLFEMGEHGLTGVSDPSSLFLADRQVGCPGSAVTVPLEGHRPLLVEVQALVGPSSKVPRRSVTGADPSRVNFLVAVLEQRTPVKIGARDIYVSVTGGARAGEPAADLAICVALASCAVNRSVRPEVVTLGEVGLGGELRRVSALAKRLNEAHRMGFGEAVIPAANAGPGPSGMHQAPVATLFDALRLVFFPSARHQRAVVAATDITKTAHSRADLALVSS
ncbi:MAG TPA: DNA repair protein RadA [Acidimicrobiales bacterium]|nr:DNA repair protein RadA [Acidimicrobiales bacterium]